MQDQIGRPILLALEVGGFVRSVSGGLVEDGPGPLPGLGLVAEQDVPLVTEPAAARPVRSLRCGRDRRVAEVHGGSAGGLGPQRIEHCVGQREVVPSPIHADVVGGVVSGQVAHHGQALDCVERLVTDQTLTLRQAR